MAFTFSGEDDPVWRAISADVDDAIVVPESLAAARDRISYEELDVLIFTDIGMEPLTYFLAFARLAPVQCVTNGHPDTTGIPTIDYFLSSGPLENPDTATHYSEQLAALDDVLVDYDRPAMPSPLRSREYFGLSEDATLYVCAQSLFKIHPDMDTAFANILANDPNGRLIVFAGPEPQWWQLLHRRWRRIFGDNIERVQLVKRQTYSDFLNILAVADLILDTWPFCGGNTAYQGLAMGTPIVTMPGRFARGRSTMALYRKMGIPELVANSPQSYSEIALRLGTQRKWRAEIAARIANRSDCLFGDSAAVDAFAGFLSTVCRVPESVS